MADVRAWRRFRQNKVAVASALILLLMAAACAIGPCFFPESHTQPSATSFSPPTLTHPCGTDLNGRDLLYRILTGGRVSLIVGFFGAAVSLIIGTAYGLVAGYVGGRVDNVMMRVVDILYSVPRLIFILVCIGALNARLLEFASEHRIGWLVSYSRIVILIFSLGVIEWLTLARIVRGQTLALKNRPFVTAAVSLGQSHIVILLRHLLPNLLGVIFIYLTLTVPAVIIDESFLSFLGLGVQAPMASWGSLLADGAGSLNPIKIRWWLVVFPAAAMAITLLALNFLGDALRDTLDPKETAK
jgi:peptide/nickel transport system permease protein/oligopeptide transport system permease protein